MKSYFAKYFPVEGEIKWNDAKDEPLFYYDLNNQSYLCKGHRMPNLEVKCTLSSGTIFYEGHARFKKAKLFLCSRDIQVGEKMQSYVPVGEPPYEIDEGICIEYISEDDTYPYELSNG